MFNCGLKVLNGKAEELVGCGGGNRDASMREPLDGLTYTLSLGADVPNTIASVVIESGT